MNQEFFYFLELYINYDFDINEKFLVYNLISIFSDIIKGRFYKNSKNNNNYSEEENNELINYSLKILSLILNSILDFSIKIFPLKKENKNKQTKKNKDLTFTSNKKNILTENLGGEYNNISIYDMNKESSLNNTYNNTYTNINNTINIFLFHYFYLNLFQYFLFFVYSLIL